MPPAVAVIIPALNEEGIVAGAIDSARRAGAHEIVVADGGSIDATRDVARGAGATIVMAQAPRSVVMNRAAAAVTSDAIVFLHSDTRLPPSAAERVALAIDEGALFGGFRLRFIEDDVRLRVAERIINLRTALTKCPWGDQAQFVRRDAFLDGGGFREIDIMEDYELATRMKRRGKTNLLNDEVLTSGRRFLDRGVVATAVTNWRIIAAWRLGVDPRELARWYRE